MLHPGDALYGHPVAVPAGVGAADLLDSSLLHIDLLTQLPAY